MERFEKIIVDAGRNTKDILKKTKDMTIHAVDQNDDGKFNLEDVAVIASVVGNSVKKRAQVLKEVTDEKTRELELKMLQPIFLEDLNNLLMPKFIRITERDKKRAESEVCKESIGFWSVQKDLCMVNIFRDSIERYDLSFYPDCNSEFYYVNPIDNENYIALNDYFEYLKQVRINELQKIAQDLGAKHFRVIYKEEQSIFSRKSEHKKMGLKPVVSTDLNLENAQRKYSRVEIAAEMKCPGHSPVMPKLKYMKYDPNVNGLIAMRMNENGPLLHQKIEFKFSNFSGLKENEAVKIDAVLKAMKCNGNATLVSETKDESRRYLEYEIDF